MNLNMAEEIGQGESYIAPDPHFISSISLFASSLPWEKFETFFESKKIVKLSGSEQLILLRLIALQELLCLDDDALLRWTKHQLYLFSFMQAGYKARLPTKALLVEFRNGFEKIGLLKPFRNQCQKIIQEHESRYPPINKSARVTGVYTPTSQVKSKKHRVVSDRKVELLSIKSNSELACPSCGSQNIVKVQASQEASTLPEINFSRCRFCGNTFREHTH